MAVKAFFRQNPSSLVWEYGTFKADGITPDIEYTIPEGKYRARWQTVNEVVYLTLVNANNLGELPPFRNIPITEVASDLIGTPYASRAAFESANLKFFNVSDGVSDGEYDAVLSDTEDLANPGWIEATLLGGTIKYTTIDGNVRTRTVDLGWCSLTRVKRVWLTGTTADMGIIVHY